MKTTKMSLANMQGKLSRMEMKNIMAGSGEGFGDSSSCSSKKCSDSVNNINCGGNSACKCQIACVYCTKA